MFQITNNILLIKVSEAGKLRVHGGQNRENCMTVIFST